jgi:hypothetical protein
MTMTRARVAMTPTGRARSERDGAGYEVIDQLDMCCGARAHVHAYTRACACPVHFLSTD